MGTMLCATGRDWTASSSSSSSILMVISWCINGGGEGPIDCDSSRPTYWSNDTAAALRFRRATMRMMTATRTNTMDTGTTMPMIMPVSSLEADGAAAGTICGASPTRPRPEAPIDSASVFMDSALEPMNRKATAPVLGSNEVTSMSAGDTELIFDARMVLNSSAVWGAVAEF